MSTPIGIFARQVRLQRGLRQAEEARLLGYEQAYISAIELGTKSPSQEFLVRFAEKLGLLDGERTAMQQAAKESRRRFILPIEVSSETYQLCSELWDKIDRLHPAQIVAIRQMIKLDDELKARPRVWDTRIRRTQKTEAEM